MDAAIAARDRELAEAAARVALAQRQVDDLEQVATRLSERVVERERELREVRGELERARGESEQAVRALAKLVERLGVEGEDSGATEVPDAPAATAAPDPGPAAVSSAPAAANGNGHHSDASAHDIFNGLIEVEIGPLSDFSQLVGFEDAASGIGATSDISVKRFTQGRATLEMHLREPVELLRELEERAPFEFSVRDTREDRVVLDVDAE